MQPQVNQSMPRVKTIQAEFLDQGLSLSDRTSCQITAGPVEEDPGGLHY